MNLRKENGVAMVLVLVTMLVLGLLGTTLVSVSTSESTNVSRQQEKMQAYYLAWSGANTVASYITTNPDSLPNMNQYVDQLVAAGQSDPVGLGDGGEFRVLVNRSGQEIIIQSTAQVGQATETTTLTLNEISYWIAPNFNTAVFSNNGLKMSNSSIIIGNVGTNSSASSSIDMSNSASITNPGNVQVGPSADLNVAIKSTGSSSVSGTLSNLSQIKVYELPPFPDFPEDLTHKGSISLNSSQTATIGGSGQYDNINLSNNSQLTINLVGETIIRVNNLELSNNTKIHLQGTGTLILYVDEEFSLSNSSTINDDGEASSLFLYYKGSESISPSNTTVFIGSIYVESAEISLSNAASISGNIITGGTKVTISNGITANVQAVYAPNANVTLSNSAEIKGALIANNVTMSNTARVTYNSSIEGGVIAPSESSANYTLGLWK